MIKHACLLLLLFPSMCMLFSCSNSKSQRIKFQVYKNDRLMYVAYHLVKENIPEEDLWKELHKQIYFTPVDGKPEVAPSNHLFNRNPYAKSKGNITILIVDGDEILSHTIVEQVAFKPAKDQKTWQLAFGQADIILKSITDESKMANKLVKDEPASGMVESTTNNEN